MQNKLYFYLYKAIKTFWENKLTSFSKNSYRWLIDDDSSLIVLFFFLNLNFWFCYRCFTIIAMMAITSSSDIVTVVVHFSIYYTLDLAVSSAAVEGAIVFEMHSLLYRTIRRLLNHHRSIVMASAWCSDCVHCRDCCLSYSVRSDDWCPVERIWKRSTSSLSLWPDLVIWLNLLVPDSWTVRLGRRTDWWRWTVSRRRNWIDDRNSRDHWRLVRKL